MNKLLLARPLLWLLVIFNGLGTIYGYMWYGHQLIYTIENYPDWLLPFVPDSPTASLFFTFALIFLLYPSFLSPLRSWPWLRATIEALGVITSIKYGIWAVTMIVWGAALGDQLNWQHYMLIASHLAMAVEAMLYVRHFSIVKTTALFALSWLLLNDTIDYSFGVFPWLPTELLAHLGAVCAFTFALSVASFGVTYALMKVRRQTS